MINFRKINPDFESKLDEMGYSDLHKGFVALGVLIKEGGEDTDFIMGQFCRKMMLSFSFVQQMTNKLFEKYNRKGLLNDDRICTLFAIATAPVVAGRDKIRGGVSTAELMLALNFGYISKMNQEI